GLTGFLTNTGTSTPFNASAISCTVNGFAVERAPIQRISTPAASASSTCLAVATSVVIGRPVSSFALRSHWRPMLPMPSNSPGRVRGFQMPARSTFTLPVLASKCAVASTCSSVSALHGPAMTKGRSPVSIHDFKGTMSNVCFIVLPFICFLFICLSFFYMCCAPHLLIAKYESAKGHSTLIVFHTFAHDVEVVRVFQYSAYRCHVISLVLPFPIHVK